MMSFLEGLLKPCCSYEGPELLRDFWFVQCHLFPVCCPSVQSDRSFFFHLIYVCICISMMIAISILILKAFAAL